jgi:hypothetical protein
MAAAVAEVGKPLTFHEESTGREELADPGGWGDVVLARKDIGTSYHIAVVVDEPARRSPMWCAGATFTRPPASTVSCRNC